MRRGLEVAHQITAREVRRFNPALGYSFANRLRIVRMDGWMRARKSACARVANGRDELSGSDSEFEFNRFFLHFTRMSTMSTSIQIQLPWTLKSNWGRA